MSLGEAPRAPAGVPACRGSQYHRRRVPRTLGNADHVEHQLADAHRVPGHVHTSPQTPALEEPKIRRLHRGRITTAAWAEREGRRAGW